MPKVDINKTRYLSFEGGGGRGLIYLGAVKALEKKYASLRNGARISGTPIIDINAPLDDVKKRPIIGISGASAGAITAFMLALGMSSNDIQTEVNKTGVIKFRRFAQLSLLKKSIVVSEFEKFFDKPDGKGMKAVTDGSNRKEYNNHYFIASTAIVAAVLLVFSTLLKVIISIYIKAKKLAGKSSIMFERFFDSNGDTSEYLYSLIFNRGMFLGSHTRVYFTKLIEDYLYRNVDWREIIRPYLDFRTLNPDGTSSGNIPLELPADDILRKIITNIDDIINVDRDFSPVPKPANELTFKELLYLTGVDLIITGTNVSRSRPLYLSTYHTPDFPVVDAVGISMNLPLIFKPVYVDYTVDSSKSASYNEKYKGLWVDGGMLNNFPIHAFDDLQELQFPFRGEYYDYKIAKTKANSVQPFCDCVLGFRLKGTPEISNPFAENYGVLPDYAGALMNTFMYSGGDGQIRSTEEENRTVYLNTYGENVKDDKGAYVDGEKYIEIAVTDFASPKLDGERGNITMRDLKYRLITQAELDTSDKIE